MPSMLMTDDVVMSSPALRFTIGYSTFPPNSVNGVPPASAMAIAESRQRTRPVICSTHWTDMVAGSDTGAAVTLANKGTNGAWMVVVASALAISSAAGCINGQ